MNINCFLFTKMDIYMYSTIHCSISGIFVKYRLRKEKQTFTFRKKKILMILTALIRPKLREIEINDFKT